MCVYYHRKGEQLPLIRTWLTCTVHREKFGRIYVCSSYPLNPVNEWNVTEDSHIIKNSEWVINFGRITLNLPLSTYIYIFSVWHSSTSNIYPLAPFACRLRPSVELFFCFPACPAGRQCAHICVWCARGGGAGLCVQATVEGHVQVHAQALSRPDLVCFWFALFRGAVPLFPFSLALFTFRFRYHIEALNMHATWLLHIRHVVRRPFVIYEIERKKCLLILNPWSLCMTAHGAEHGHYYARVRHAAVAAKPFR